MGVVCRLSCSRSYSTRVKTSDRGRTSPCGADVEESRKGVHDFVFDCWCMMLRLTALCGGLFC